MATPEVTTCPSPAQDSPSSARTNNPKAPLCSYCQRPIAKRILAARKSYCQKLCAALGLIADVHEQDAIEDCSYDAMVALLDSVFNEGPRAYPVKVRFWDALKFDYESDTRPDFQAVVVAIDDDSTPDWIPGPSDWVFDADQDDIDCAVEKLLTQEPTGGEEARP